MSVREPPQEAAPGLLQELHEKLQAQALQFKRLERRSERERLARKEAERLLDFKSAELFEALQQTRESERHLQLALWASGEGIWSWQAEGDLMEVRHLVMADQPVEPLQDTATRLRHIVHREDMLGFSLAWSLVTTGSRADIDAACRVRWRGEWRWVRLRGRGVEHGAQGQARRIVGTIKDITRQREADRSLRLMAHAFANTHDAMAVVDGRWRVVEGNVALARLLAMPPAELPGLALLDHLNLPVYKLTKDEAWRGELLLSGRGQPVEVDVVVTAVDPIEGESQYTVVALQDARERKRAQEELRRQALSDALTGLPNRTAILKHLEEVLQRGEPAGLLFIDLDGFKQVNDAAGHAAGDDLLRELAMRLGFAVPPPAFVGRWGGDEFVVVAPGQAEEHQVRALGHAILERCRQTVPTLDRQVAVGASLGAVLAPRDGLDAATLIRRADAAMYRAKESGRNQLAFFEPALETAVRRRAGLITQLRLDAEQDGFDFHVQSIVDRTGTVVAGEMLMRWSTAAFGAVSPAEFIPLAEEAGLMPRMGLHALRCATQAALQLDGLGSPAQLAVNLSARQLQDSGLADRLLAMCAQRGVPPRRLVLELTESTYLGDMAVAVPQLHALREAGFGLALDDFGTGYSSLSQLCDLPFSKVKLDRTFVRELGSSPRASAMLEGVVQICRGLGVTTVAEGVETQDQYQRLIDLGVDLFQGYHLGRPQPLEQWLQAVGAAVR
ncbi:putative bifunctional diguanylate cyclase/phosphodiesterase [Ramlibacter sp. MAHUQ-53]|uniref:putative bifunctional diguanylate cyclase/phosphodiesterase n=1 Tax=unclassified Ramlibacter TaxID=2617605 RepID=UPI00364107E7